MRHIEALLRRHIGLDAASVGSALIERAVRLRMREYGLEKPDTYRDLLATSREELMQLIEAVVVTETWFFRDRQSFNIFTQLALEDWWPRHPAGTLRVLSLPCSSGEEPYSLAMALLDAGSSDLNFSIDALDISALALARAERAVYGKNSFRGRELAFRDRHFRLTKEGYALSARVRRNVKFERGNLLDDGFLAERPPYDFIFCRNLLIYFDSATQVLALDRLQQLLADDGILFVGPAELPAVVARGLVSAGLPMAFACHKAGGRTQPAPVRSLKSDVGEKSPPPKLSRETSAAIPEPLEVARQHADAGRLAEAAAICEAQLASAGPSAQAYYLLGLVKDAGNDPEAITYYRKALYLEPNYYEALVQIALVLKKTGAVDAARLYQRRAERAHSRT